MAPPDPRVWRGSISCNGTSLMPSKSRIRMLIYASYSLLTHASTKLYSFFGLWADALSSTFLSTSGMILVSTGALTGLPREPSGHFQGTSNTPELAERLEGGATSRWSLAVDPQSAPQKTQKHEVAGLRVSYNRQRRRGPQRSSRST